MHFVGFFNPAYSEETNSLKSPGRNGEITIESVSQTSDSTSDTLSAFGNVRLSYPSQGIYASSKQALFLRKEGIIVLSGDVRLIKNSTNSLQSERIVYSLTRDELIADSYPGDQVLLKLFLGSR